MTSEYRVVRTLRCTKENLHTVSYAEYFCELSFSVRLLRLHQAAQEDDEDYTRDDTTVQNSKRSQSTIASVAFGDPIYEDTHTPLQAKMEVIACLEPFQ